jgi:hypothetical protein
MILTSKERAYERWGHTANSEETIVGRDIFQNSCTSCHDTGNGIMGGKVSTRTLQMLVVFAKNSEEYFRKLLVSPKDTNPLAEKMPSYKHYSERQVGDLIAYLKSRWPESKTTCLGCRSQLAGDLSWERQSPYWYYNSRFAGIASDTLNFPDFSIIRIVTF